MSDEDKYLDVDIDSDDVSTELKVNEIMHLLLRHTNK